MTLNLKCICNPVRCVRNTSIEVGDVFLIYLMVNADRLPFCFLGFVRLGLNVNVPRWYKIGWYRR